MPELLALKTAVRTQGRPAQMRNYASEVTIHSGSSLLWWPNLVTCSTVWYPPCT